jgi:hypothetical protein
MEATIDIELPPGINELVIKELAVVCDVIQTFLFRPPYPMEPHGSEENGLNWSDGYIPYDQVFTVLSEAVALYDHLYARGEEKSKLRDILNRPIHNYETLDCPDPMELKSSFHCYLTCHTFAVLLGTPMPCIVGYSITSKLNPISNVLVIMDVTMCGLHPVYQNLMQSCDLTCFSSI